MTLENYLNVYSDRRYSHTSLVRHKGTVIAFAMDDQQRIVYSVLALGRRPGRAADSSPPPTLDKDAWVGPKELIFPTEIAEVGYGVADQTRLPVYEKDSPAEKTDGTVLPNPKSDDARKYDYFRSTTARFSADAPFQTLSDGRYVYIFRQAVAAGASNNLTKRDARGEPVRDRNQQPVSMVDSTMLVDRFLLLDTTLTPKMEVRYRRSRSKSRPQNRKDSLGAKDMDDNPFYEPTQELRFVGNLVDGRFAVLTVPTQVAEVERWQIFAQNQRTGAIDMFNVERSAEGLFNTRGSQIFTCIDHDEVFETEPGTCVEPSVADAARLCDKALIPRLKREGHAESALLFEDGTDWIKLDAANQPGPTFTFEAWLYPMRHETTQPQALIISGTSGKNAGPSLWVERQTRLKVGFGDGKQWHEYSTRNLLSLNQWSHIAVTFDKTDLRFYVNGQLREKSDSMEGITPFAGKLASFGAASDSYTGRIDEIRIWDRARSARELREDTPRRLTGLEPGLTGYWRLDEANGQQVYDQTGGGADGQVNGATWIQSDAPVGENPGVNRSSLRIDGRRPASGMAALQYYQQAAVASGHSGEEKPLKQSGRVMLALATECTGRQNDKPYMSVLDFGVSATGRLAQIPDSIDLTAVDPDHQPTNESLNDLLDRTSGLQQRVAVLRSNLEDLDEAIGLSDDAIRILTAALESNAPGNIPPGELDRHNTTLTELRNARVDAQQGASKRSVLEQIVKHAPMRAYEHPNFTGRNIIANLTNHPDGKVTYQEIVRADLNDQISSIQLQGTVARNVPSGSPIKVTIYEHAEGSANQRATTLTASAPDLRIPGIRFDDTISHIEIQASDAYTQEIERIAKVERHSQAKVAELEADVQEIIADVQQRRDLAAAQRLQTANELEAARVELTSANFILSNGAAATMTLVHIDPFGLSISGGLLQFAWSRETPLLFDSASGSLALYFRGTDDQFFVTYYDTLTERARYLLAGPSGDTSVICVARSAALEMDDLVIEVQDDPDEPDDANWCTVSINAAGIEETWRRVPRSAVDFADTINGVFAEREFVGWGRITAPGGHVAGVEIPDGIRRNVDIGRTIVVGDIRLELAEAASAGQTQIAATSPTLNPVRDLLPVFYLQYDYINHASTTRLPADLYNGSLLVAAAAADEPGRQVDNQHVSSGATLTCRWTAAAPGHALAFDGETAYAYLEDLDDLDSLDAPDDLTLEAWVRPSEFEGRARLIQHHSPSSSYSLGLRAEELRSALHLKGTSFVDLGDGVALEGAFTQEVWIYPSPRDENFHGILGSEPDGGASAVGRSPSLFITERTKVHAGFSTGREWLWFTTDDVLIIDRWNHLAVSFDGNVYRVYVNGLLEHEDTTGFQGKAAAPIPVTQLGRVGTYYFPGRIDEVRLWKRARSQDEIVRDMNHRLGGNETDLVGYWSFDGGQAIDRSRFRRHGTIQGNPVAAPSPIPAFSVFAGVNNLYTHSRGTYAGGNWTHLAVAFGQAYAVQFVGGDSYLDCGSHSALDIGRDLTVEVFLTGTAPRCAILSQGRLDDHNLQRNVPYALYLTPDRHLGFLFQDATGQVHRFASTGRVPDGFCRVAVTRQRQQNVEERNQSADISVWDRLTFYINGAASGTFDYTDAQRNDRRVGKSPGPFEIGRGLPGVADPYRGAISEIRIWNRALESQDVGAAIGGDTDGLVAWWRFDEGSGTTSQDSKGSAHARFRGGAVWVEDPNPSGSELTLYVDGVIAATDLVDGSTLMPADPQFTLGALAGSEPGELLAGELEEVRLWAVRRTEEQIQDNMFRRLTGEKADLIAYFPFDLTASNGEGASADAVADHSLRGNHLRIADGTPVISTAPVGDDAPEIRSALAGVRTTFNDLIHGRPAVAEYGDTQRDARGDLIGVLKRAYSYVKNGRWHLTTGFKVGDLVTEWIGQVQFAPQLKGYIEGAPPVPSENLTTRAVEGIGDLDDYNEASTIAIVDADETTYSYAASREDGNTFSLALKAGVAFATNIAAGIFVQTDVLETENAVGAAFQLEHAWGWLADARTSVGTTTARSTSLELRGAFAPPGDPLTAAVGRRFVPDNVGLALVESETADVFALRLAHNGALIAYNMRPNPDIPKDWNIITFPINPRYTKQGTLDGKIGLTPDLDYPNAMTYRPDSSYFKPIEAYAQKRSIEAEETALQLQFNQYNAGSDLRAKLASGRILDKLPQLHKRNLVNTYVWTADGGLFAETQETMDAREETVGGYYEFDWAAGLFVDIHFTVKVGVKLELDVLGGGHLNLTEQKTQESTRSFALEVGLDKVERDIYQRDEDNAIVFSYDDPLRPRPIKHAGKVDAYRFMTFYLEPKSDHRDVFFNRVVDPIWLEQSDDPAAVALREARSDAKQPACWRVMHRVTYVSRILPAFDEPVPGSLEQSMRELDIDSNYELIKVLDPFVRDKMANFGEFSQAVDRALEAYLPELQPHAPQIKQFVAGYYGLGELAGGTDGEDRFGGDAAGGRPLDQPPVVFAGEDQLIGLDGASTSADLEATVIDDRYDQTEQLFLTWEKVSGEGDVTFSQPHAAATQATFTSRGRYVLRLTADDGVHSDYDELAVVVNERPVISAGTNRQIPGLNTTLEGVILDDGLGDPQTGVVTATWSQQSSMGTVAFTGNGQLRPAATFGDRGHYLLQLSVNNGKFTATDEVMIAVAARETDGLLALYTFEEPQTDLVIDVSGDPDALQLTIKDPAAVRWVTNALELAEPTLLTTAAPAARVSEAISRSGEVTIEAWVRPANDRDPGLARILTLSGGPGERNFTLGQSEGSYHAGFRTTTTDRNASVKALAGGTVRGGELAHVVCTRDAAGLVRLFVDGEETAARTVDGDLSNWDPTFTLALGDELGSPEGHDRSWLGSYHLVAIYDRALTGDIVRQHYDFGPDANLPPILTAGQDREVDWAASQPLPITVPLAASVTHDRPALRQSVRWTQVAGPDAPNGVDFADETALRSDAFFERFGRYTMRVTADDGELMTSDEVTVTVNQPPRVAATENHALSLIEGSISTALAVTVLETGLGAGTNDVLTYAWRLVSGPETGLVIADSAAARTDVTFHLRGLYQLEVVVDNGRLSTAAQVAVTVHQPPVVTAGGSRVHSMLEAVSKNGGAAVAVALAGGATDDGLGNPGQSLMYEWSQVAGPGTPDGVVFADAADPQTTAEFAVAGLYRLRLTGANPDDPALTASAEVAITINQPPVVDAGPDMIVNLPDHGVLDATLSDDGLPAPPGVLSLAWRVTGGPDGAMIADPAADFTTVAFPDKGIYTLELEATDGHDAVADGLQVTVNKAPTIETSENAVVQPGESAMVTCAVIDDGLGDPGAGTVTVTWKPVDPGVTVEATGPTDVTVTVPGRGAYDIEVMVSNGFLSTTDVVQVVAVVPPVVDAGDDGIAEKGVKLQLAGEVTDTGLADPTAGDVSLNWDLESGPGTASFTRRSTPNTKVTFSEIGDYVVALSADNGYLNASDSVRVVVHAPPTISAGADGRARPGRAVALKGEIVSDGLGVTRAGSLAVAWELVSGRGEVRIADPASLETKVTFPNRGRYVLRLRVDNGFHTSSDEVTFRVGGG